MGPKGKQKPINVLTEFITTWIRRNSAEALPFDSFESLRNRRITQKDVERWIFNCNYTYYRLGNLLYQTGALPNEQDALQRILDDLDTTFKSISDSTPLNLRSRPNDAAAHELARDWPPFQPESRNTLDRLTEQLAAFAHAQSSTIPHLEQTLHAFSDRMTAEAQLFAELRAASARASHALATRCRALLPLWILADINPMMSLLLWDDEDSVSQLVDLLRASFSSWHEQGPEATVLAERWRSATLRAQALYLENIDDEDPEERSLPELATMLKNAAFSLDDEQPPAGLPRWLLGKSQLIWNVVICTILGPSETVGPTGPVRDATVSPHPLPLPLQPITATALAGEVLLRRRYRTGRIETIDRLMLESVCSTGLWHVIGGHYDSHAPLPQSAFRDQYLHLGAAYVHSELLDAKGGLIEGAGDSRFHVELSLRVDDRSHARIVARDVGSKNGTSVVRSTEAGVHVFALSGRRRLSRADWAERLGLDECQITTVDELELQRGDIIQLAGSCFELI